MKSEKVTISLRIPRENLAKLKVIAKHYNRSLTEEILFLIDQDCGKHTEKT